MPHPRHREDRSPLGYHPRGNHRDRAVNEPSWQRNSRADQHATSWSFWRVVAAVAVGSLIAAAVIWVAAEARARYELRQLERALHAEALKLQAEMQAHTRAQEERARARRNQQRRQEYQAQEAKRKRREEEQQRAATLAAAALRDQKEGRYFPAAASDMKRDTWACKDRQIVRRTADGWMIARDGSGKPGRCRTDP